MATLIESIQLRRGSSLRETGQHRSFAHYPVIKPEDAPRFVPAPNGTNNSPTKNTDRGLRLGNVDPAPIQYITREARKLPFWHAYEGEFSRPMTWLLKKLKVRFHKPTTLDDWKNYMAFRQEFPVAKLPTKPEPHSLYTQTKPITLKPEAPSQFRNAGVTSGYMKDETDNMTEKKQAFNNKGTNGNHQQAPIDRNSTTPDYYQMYLDGSQSNGSKRHTLLPEKSVASTFQRIHPNAPQPPRSKADFWKHEFNKMAEQTYQNTLKKHFTNLAPRYDDPYYAQQEAILLTKQEMLTPIEKDLTGTIANSSYGRAVMEFFKTKPTNRNGKVH